MWDFFINELRSGGILSQYLSLVIFPEVHVTKSEGLNDGATDSRPVSVWPPSLLGTALLVYRQLVDPWQNFMGGLAFMAPKPVDLLRGLGAYVYGVGSGGGAGEQTTEGSSRDTSCPGLNVMHHDPRPGCLGFLVLAYDEFFHDPRPSQRFMLTISLRNM